MVLPNTLYPVLCSLLGDEGRRAEQAELLLYTALLPTLAPPLPAIASLLAWPGLPAAPATAFLTSQVLARLPAQDWHGLAAALPDLGPALARLVTGLAAQPPAQLHRQFPRRHNGLTSDNIFCQSSQRKFYLTSNIK